MIVLENVRKTYQMGDTLVQALRDELAAKGDELNAQARSVGVSATALPRGVGLENGTWSPRAAW